MWNVIKNFFSRKIKLRDRNTVLESSTKITGVEFDIKEIQGKVGGISHEKKESPAVITEEIALKNLQHGQTAEIIDGIDDYKSRENLKQKYAETLIIERATSVEKKKLDDQTSAEIKNCAQLKSFLEDRGFVGLFIPNNLCESGTLLWPMNVQDSITYIHVAQFNLAKLFIQAGWNLKIIIGDCGHNSSKNDYTARDEFTKILIDFFKKNNLSNDKYTIIPLSEYFTRKQGIEVNIEQGELLTQFHIICDSVLWREYKDEILKEYDDTTKYKIEQRKILSNIQPLLIWSVVAAINQFCINNNTGKVLVLAGQDEFKQWKRIVDTRRRNNLGAIFIQELKTADGKTMDQTEIKISNKAMLQEKINNNENLARWLFLHFIELPNFGKSRTQFPFCNIPPQTCNNNENCIKCLFEDRHYDNGFDKSKYVTFMYPLINIAN